MDAIFGSEHTTDFCKPLTVDALRRFDPELRLLFNRRVQTFQVFRVVNRPQVWTEPRLVWVCDWLEGLAGSDNPAALLGYLRAGDSGPEGQEQDRLQQESDEATRQFNERFEKTSRDEFDHAARDNRRQLIRAYQPFRDLTAFVR